MVLFIILAGAVAYVNTLNGEWVWDDFSSVLLHRHVQQPAKFFQLFREDQHAFGRGQGNFYRPLVAASFMLDYLLAGGTPTDADDNQILPNVSPFVFHITNAIWHILAALLLYALLIRIRAPRLAQWSVPLIFVLHPLHTEAVAYISGRADMMSACFIFAALFCALSPAPPPKKHLWAIASLLLFALGLLCKESSLIYPCLLAILAIWVPPMPMPSGSSSHWPGLRARLLPLVGSLFILALYLAMRSTVLKFTDEAAVLPLPLHQRLLQCLQAAGIYARLLFVSTGLHMERTLNHATFWHAMGGALFLTGIMMGIFWGHVKKYPAVAVGFAWFLAAWFPISGIFPLNAPLAEHWMYVPMAGFWWAMVAAVERTRQLSRFRIALYVVIAGWLLFFLGTTVQRNKDWRDQETLFRSTLAHNPESARVHFNLAVAYDYILNNWSGARRHYELFLRIRENERQRHATANQRVPLDELEARLSLGRMLFLLKDYAGAANLLSPMITALPKDPPYLALAAEASWLAGKSLLALGEIIPGHAALEQARTLEPQRAAEIEAFISGAPFSEGF